MNKQQSETMNKVMAKAEIPTPAERPKREFKPRPEVKINKPFAALAGLKIGK